ncbi:unnamed protein product [Ambrosiozyma monospora]|uniref:Unnamed protein product n=1 Tax=Ambrosiozyma monospora TaxID=43982 RepID=A0ACB5STC8_AMBMO|nr:unnamed protein product [Ambrosiozyma monospora]
MPSSNKYPNSPSMRAMASSPLPQSRQASIVEMLSTPPPLDPQVTPQTDSAFLFNSISNNGYNPLNNSNFIDASLSSNPDSPTSFNNQLSRNPSISSSVFQLPSGTSLEWKDIPLAELVEKSKLITIDAQLSVEQAFETLVNNGLTSVPVEEYPQDLNCLTFDYADLNTYLLMVLNKLKPETLLNAPFEPKEDLVKLIKKAQSGEQVPVKFVISLTTKNPFIKLNETDTLSTVVEILGSGVHRIAITKENKMTGVLSQRRLVKFLWDNARRFPSMEPLLSSSLKSLNIGSSNVITIFGDQLLIEGLMKMHNLAISSLAVVDRNYNLLGNISVTDVKLVTKSSQSNLFYKSCLHFISVILNSRGLESGKDSFPIFHVTSSSSLGRTIAKLVATKSHRLWIVKPEGSSPAASISSSIQPDTASIATPSKMMQSPVPSSMPMHSSPSASTSSFNEISGAGTVDKDSRSSGKLVGVVSLTDILSVLAKTLGKDYVDPTHARKQRRRSSSGASSRTSASFEQYRKSISDPSER